ncbi:porphobilinogen deaminase [Dispira parvispora]|uniref:hydroxymethylbilane synthase n=1 Tax=Dispira parvispora TaxID=1520584 RepID=A0A9W8E5R8_9FUNG|nr:porphobilinogen deaminase [Dispira parvispora]
MTITQDPSDNQVRSGPNPSTDSHVKPVGSRKSALALVQTNYVRQRLQDLHPDTTFPLVTMTTTGDNILNVALSKIGEKSLFTKELEVALEAKQVDLVVHSLKDLPTTLPPGMVIGAILEREDPRDAVVMKNQLPYRTLEALPPGSVVGTSSVRRIAQLKRKYPHLQFADVRGNLNTRLQKLDQADGPFSALILAVAGLRRLDLNHRITEILPESTILHAVGQGALAVECRENDQDTLALLQSLNHHSTLARCVAERTLMRELEGGCSVPLGVCTEWQGAGAEQRLQLRALVATLDGGEVIEAEDSILLNPTDANSTEKATSLGLSVAALMKSRGAKELLDSIRTH